MNVRIMTLLVSVLLLGIGQAQAAESESTKQVDTNACTWFTSIDNWQRLDDRHLIVWGSGNDAYLVELSLPLFDLDTAPSIAFVDHNHDGRVCGFGMDEIVIPHAAVFRSSTIIGMTQLDSAALAAVAKKYHVDLGRQKQKPGSDKQSDG